MTLSTQYLYIEKNLLETDLKQIEEISSKGVYVDGRHSFNNSEKYSNLKSNSEIRLEYDDAMALTKVIYDRMYSHPEFIFFTAVKSSPVPILSKMVAGDYFNPHEDSHEIGDFSTTYFLSDPDTYDGGELCLWVNGEEKKFKPPAGSSVTYKTGIPHRVNTVTRGVRNVAVSWAHSKIKDQFELELFYKLSLLKNKLPDITSSTLDMAINDPKFIANNLIEMILRKQYG